MIEIRAISSQNPWWVDEKEIEKDSKVAEALSKKNKLLHFFQDGNFLILGPRQVGKTTYLKLLIHDLIENKKVNPKNILYFTCERLSKKDEIFELVETFDRLSAGKKFLFLDEITFVQDWDTVVKFLLDSNFIKNKFLYITGSTSATFKKERFPGRDIKVKEFLPLSFRDFCLLFGSKKLKEVLANLKISEVKAEKVYDLCNQLLPFSIELQTLFEKYIECGGFPISAFQLVENEKIKEETFDIYINWILGDISKLEKSERIFKSVLQGVLKNYGTKFSLNSIAKEMEIGSHVTVREYLEFLEKIYVLRNYFRIDLNKKVPIYRGERKVYFIDPFLFKVFNKYVRGISEIPEDKLSLVIEGIVAESLRRRFNGVFFFHNRKEIDCVIGKVGIEIKYGKVSKEDFPKVEIKEKILLSKDYLKDFVEIKVVPVSLFLVLL